MTQTDARSAERPDFDKTLAAIADYVTQPGSVASETALDTARYCLLDSLACAFLALDHPECRKLLGPIFEGAYLPGASRVAGTHFELEPTKAAFDTGTLIRWLDFNDTWLAQEWGHPSDNLGAILAVADYLGRVEPLPVRSVLEAMIKAHEIQGVLALNHSFNRRGLDHVLLVRIASTAVVTHLLGGDRDAVLAAVSHAFIDGGALRTYRHAPNTGPRKSWAAGDACRRAVELANIVLRGEMGYPSALSARTWGFQDVLFGGSAIELERPLGCYVMENVLFKISFPAEFHAQTAVEAALALHELVGSRIEEIERIEIETQEAGKRIIDKTGPLDNYADRDHCLQYMVAVPLLYGELTAASYSDAFAADPRIDALRSKMNVRENPEFTKAYFDPEQRAIPNAINVIFTDGSEAERVQVDFPVGHKRRREEGKPLLRTKFEDAVRGHFASRQSDEILAHLQPDASIDALQTDELMSLVSLRAL